MTDKPIGILDIGSHKIKFLIISKDSEDFIIIHSKRIFNALGVKSGNVTDYSKLSNVLKQCIGEAEKEAGIELNEIYVGISSRDIKFTNFGISKYIGSFEIDEKKDIQNLINLSVSIFEEQNSNHKILHFLKKNFLFNKKDIVDNPLGLKAESLEGEFNFISIHQNHLDNYSKAISSVGLKVKRFFFSPYAISVLSANDEELQKGFVHIDFGFEKTGLVVFKNENLLYSKIIPIGSNHITKDISKAFDIENNIAENIKISKFDSLKKEDNFQKEKFLDLKNFNLENKISNLTLNQVIEARIEEIIEYIINEIKFSDKNFITSKKIIISGGGSNFALFKQTLEKKINCNVQYTKQTFPIKNTEFNIFNDYLVCLGIAKLIFYSFKNEINSIDSKKQNWIDKFYSFFIKN